MTGLEPVRCRQRWILSHYVYQFHHTETFTIIAEDRPSLLRPTAPETGRRPAQPPAPGSPRPLPPAAAPPGGPSPRPPHCRPIQGVPGICAQLLHGAHTISGAGLEGCRLAAPVPSPPERTGPPAYGWSHPACWIPPPASAPLTQLLQQLRDARIGAGLDTQLLCA